MNPFLQLSLSLVLPSQILAMHQSLTLESAAAAASAHAITQPARIFHVISTSVDDQHPPVAIMRKLNILLAAENECDAFMHKIKMYPPHHQQLFCKMARAKDGKTALHIAVAVRSIPFIKFLIARHVDINAADNEGHTALFNMQDPDILRLFIAHGAVLSSIQKLILLHNSTPTTTPSHKTVANPVAQQPAETPMSDSYDDDEDEGEDKKFVSQPRKSQEDMSAIASTRQKSGSSEKVGVGNS